jgi:hypothetical protein
MNDLDGVSGFLYETVVTLSSEVTENAEPIIEQAYKVMITINNIIRAKFGLPPKNLDYKSDIKRIYDHLDDNNR